MDDFQIVIDVRFVPKQTALLSWATNGRLNSRSHLAFPDQLNALCGTRAYMLYEARPAGRTTCRYCLRNAQRDSFEVPA